MLLTDMSLKEKTSLKIILESYQKMSDFDKGYFLGLVEGKVEKKEEKEKNGNSGCSNMLQEENGQMKMVI